MNSSHPPEDRSPTEPGTATAGEAHRLSPLARALAETVATSRTLRVKLEALRGDAYAADLSLAGSPDARERLAEAIEELRAVGLVTAPRGPKSWDRGVLPPLPHYVVRVRTETKERPDTEPGTAEPVWHALLSWVPEFLATERPSPTELRVLLAVQHLLRDGAPITVPLRELSLELLGNEKTLDSVTRGRLFTTPGRLTHDLLAAERVLPPLIESTIGPGPDTLIVENYTTYVSLMRALRGHRGIGRLVWGAGDQVPQLLPQFSSSLTGRILYFGDLDLRGLEIGASASAISTELGLPTVQPSRDLYGMLLTHGVLAADSRTLGDQRVSDAVAWLPVEHQAAALGVLSSGHRMAQEAVGRRLLSHHPLPAQLY